MKPSKKYDVFISYSRKDFDEVEALVKQLKQAIPSLTYWFDLTGIESGDDFEERIIAAIDNSAFVLFALSENSMNSPWTKDEVMYAKNTGKRVLPVLMKDAVLSDGWFLFKFGRVDCIDSANNLQVAKLVRNLSQWTQKPMAIWMQEMEPEHEKNNLAQQKLVKAPKPTWLKWTIAAVSALVLALVLWLVWPAVSGDPAAKGVPALSAEAGTAETPAEPAEAPAAAPAHTWVDLGLSVMWATCNLGATTPEAYGHYFAWGETQTPADYQWASYVHGAAPDKLTKYCNDPAVGLGAYTDRKKVLEPADDAATTHWGKAWRMPTHKEMEELCSKCTWTWTSENGVNGYKVEAKNGNSIFLPAAGSFGGTQVHFEGAAGFYWCSNLSQENPRYAYSLGFNQEEISCNGDAFRLIRRSIRPVCRKQAAYKMMQNQ